MKIYFSLSDWQEGTAGASAIIGCIPGALFAGFFSDSFGRRKTLFFCAFCFALSSLLAAMTHHFTLFLAARVIGGIGIGASSMICPIYIAESAPPESRGRLGAFFQFGIVFGIFATLFINAFIQGCGGTDWNTHFGWRWMFGLGVFPALLLFILLRFVLESPRWLWQKGRSGEAVAVFEKLGLQDEAIELTTAQNTAQNAADQGSLRELFSKTLRRPLLIALVLAVFAQLSGINAIMYYSTKIFQSAGVGIQNAFYSSVVIGFINLLFTIIAMLFVDRMGRRSLLLPGTFIQFVALAGVSFLFYQQYNGPLLLVFILVFIAAFASAMGPLPWIICSELFPTRIRGRAMSLATFALWSACYLVAQTFPYLNGSSSVGPVGTFGIFAGCSLFSFLFAFFLIPETKGKTLEEIENFWKKKGVAHE